MNLDQFEQFSTLDVDKMCDQLNALPEQLEKAWELGFSLPLPTMQPVKKVIVAGMGGSAIGADLLISYLEERVTVPVMLQRDYGLPAFAFGKDTLVVISSHSGNTEETLSAFEEACRSNCQVLVITTGGKVLDDAQIAGVPAWMFVHKGQPRSAVGYSFGLLLALFVRLGLVSDLTTEVKQTAKLLKDYLIEISIETPIIRNPAKRLAGQLMGRHVTVFASGFMSPVARRWKCQINEVSKAIASFEVLPEADHNTLAGIFFPPEVLDKQIAIFLQASTEKPRNQKRVVETRQILMVEGLNTDLIDVRGKNRLEQLWSGILLGDYVSYYLAMLYDVDPTTIPPIWTLKEAMNK